MAIVFSCACGQKFSVGESLAGKSARCKKCGAAVVIPQAAPEEPEEVELVAEEEAAPVPVDEPKRNAAGKGPRPRKRRAKTEARRRPTRGIVLGSLAAVGAVAGVGLGLLLIPLFRGKPDGGPGGGTELAAAPGGFAVVDTPGEAPQVNGDVAKQKEYRRLVKKLADEAPPFDPAQAPTMRSTLGHLLWLGGNSEGWIEASEKRLRGEPIPADIDVKYLDPPLRGQGGAAQAAAAEMPRGVWEPIPIDEPSAPFKIGLTTGIPLEPTRGGPATPA